MTARHACRLLLRWGLPIAGIGYLAYLFANSDSARLLEHLQPAALAVALASAVIYCLAFYLLAISWGLTLRRFAAAPLDLLEVIDAYALANFAKYLPGSVFHYVGRQVAATRLGCSQKAAAKATALEIAVHLVTAGCLLGLLLPFASDLAWLQPVTDHATALWPLLLLAAVAGGGALLYFRICRGGPLRLALDPRLLATVLGLQLVFFMVATLIGAWLAVTLLQAPASSLAAVAFAHLLAWLIAFVTPGAPAGLGVREALLAAALQAYGDPSTILVVVALSRVVLVAGDGLFAVSAHFLRSRVNRPLMV